jgi:2-dehydro-3-deoxy-D-arabinonate dehydratase
LPISLRITRDGDEVFSGETSTSMLKRDIEEIAGWLTREMAFPGGVILMTGTCLVPEEAFTLTSGDRVRVSVGELVLENPVE